MTWRVQCRKKNVTKMFIVFRRWSRFVVLDALRVAGVQYRRRLFGVRPENRSEYDGKTCSVQAQTNIAILQSFSDWLQCIPIVQGELHSIITITNILTVLKNFRKTTFGLFGVHLDAIILTWNIRTGLHYKNF